MEVGTDSVRTDGGSATGERRLRRRPLRARWLRRLSVAGTLGLLAAPSFAEAAWTARAPMPTGRSNFVCAEGNGLLYAVGGYVGTTSPLSALEVYDPAVDAWSSRQPMPTARLNAAGAFVGGILYVVGGFDYATWQPIATVEAYDPATDTWSTKQPMPTARYGMAATAIDGILYVVGGIGVGSGCHTVLTTTEAYDPATDTWAAKAPMPTARASCAAAALDGVLYALGGEGCVPGLRYATLEAYDPATDTWSSRAPMSTTRGGVGAAALGGLVYAVGGASGFPYTYLASVEAYDPAADAWTSQPSMGTARHSTGVAAVNGTLYAVGGTNDSAWFTRVEALSSGLNAEPVADAGADQSLGATSAGGAEVQLDGSGSHDDDGDPLTYQWNAPAGVVLDDPGSPTPSGTFPPGVHMVTLTVSDGQGGFDVDDVVVEVIDDQPPQAVCTTDLAVLCPPNHRMVEVRVEVLALDILADPSELVLASVHLTSDERDDATGNGDGTTTGDVNGSDGHAAAVDVTSSFAFDVSRGTFVGHVTLRAERSAAGDGRSYAIEAVVEDASGNATTTGCVVVVPHSRGR